MPQSEFYSHNLGRAFPLRPTDDETTFPVLTDVKIIVRPSAGYDHSRHSVKVTWFGTLEADVATLLGVAPGPYAVFTATADSLAGTSLLAVFDSESPFAEVELVGYTTEDIEAVMTGYDMPVVPQASELISGWATSGDPSRYPLTYVEADLPIEPRCVLNTAEPGADVGKTYVYNRTLSSYTPPEGCEHMHGGISLSGDYELVHPPIEGPVWFKGGHQVRLSQDTPQSIITITADGGPGEGGQACDVAALTGLPIDAAPKCDEVVRSINGIDGPTVRIDGVAGVAIRSHPEFNRLVVQIGSAEMEVCAPDITDGQTVEYYPTNDDGQYCGDDNTPPLVPGSPGRGTDYDTDISITDNVKLRFCQWRANSVLDGWDLDAYPCGSPNTCSEPDRLPEIADELLETACLPIPQEDGQPVLNGDFSDAIDLAGWDSSDGVAQLSAFGALPPEAFPLADIPGGGHILQKRIRPEVGFHLLQLDAFTDASDLRVTLTDHLTGTIIQQFTHSTYTSDVQQLDFGPFRLDMPALDLKIENLGTDPALVGFISLTRQ